MTSRKKTVILLVSAACLSLLSVLLYAFGNDTYHLIPCFFASACITVCSHYTSDSGNSKKYIIAACIIYTAGILTSTVFRKDMRFLFTSDSAAEWLKGHLLLKPFHNIRNYCKNLYSSRFFHSFTNLFGNLAAFVPYSLFLPKIFKKANTRLGFFWIMMGLILFVETGETIFMSGFFEIDDILLNLGGAWIAYELLQNDITRRSVDEKLNLK